MRNDLKKLLDFEVEDNLMIQDDSSGLDDVTCGQLLEDSIYCLLSEDEIVALEAWQAKKLNEDSADVENLDLLEMQAKEYFKKPVYFPLKEDEIDYVTGFISLFYGFDSNGEIKFKGTGKKVLIPLSEVESIDAIKQAVEGIGFELNELIQVKLYSPGLHSIVGSTDYKQGESKNFQIFSEEYPNVLFAIPSDEEVDSQLGDDSIFSSLNSALRDANRYGYSAEEVLGKEGFAHWSVTKEFYESRLPEIVKSLVEDKKASFLQEERLKFKSKFCKEISWIQDLNLGKVKVSNLMSTRDSHFVNRILYVSKSVCFKDSIKSKAIRDQLISLTKFLNSNVVNKESDVELSDREKAIELIKRINKGDEIVVHELDPELVKSTIQLLWDRSAGYQIDYKFVQTYFQLKERFKALRSSLSAA